MGGSWGSHSCPSALLHLKSCSSFDSSISVSMFPRSALYMVKLVKVWKNKSVINSTKLWLIGALVWPISTCGCEAWTWKKQDKRIQAIENKCIRKMMWISLYKNWWPPSRFTSWKMPEVYCWNTCVHENYVTLDILWDNRGTILRAAWWQVLLRESYTVGRGRPRVSWIDNILMWTGLTETELMSAVRDRRN